MNEDNGENIVISGISGRFPKSNNMREFAHNLYNKVDMVDDSEMRWKHCHPEVPKRTGKINNLEKFDASFFSIHKRLANTTDPQARILLEHSYEAILDAGVSPQSLIGSRTGVFVGCSYSDSKDAYFFKVPAKDGHAITGNAMFYLANRISYALGLNGPSFVVDTACSSSAYALDIACKYIRSGVLDAALIGGSQITNNLISTTEFNRLRILAQDGICQPFDKNAHGYARADTIAMIFIQKAKDSKRIYANVVYTNANNDGFKQEGPSFPSRVLQQRLFDECFLDLKMNPNVVGYVEAHSTGTYFGDAEEVAGIDGAFCKDRPKPLPIGSIKSNMGHAEASSAIASIAKLILVLENQKIPPNINLNELRNDIPAFAEGRIRVVTEVEDFKEPYASLNSFGLGGANAHVLFKANTKSKFNNGIPRDNLSRLVCWSGRTESALNSIFSDIMSRPLDAEHVALLQGTQTQTSVSNTYRGFGIFRYDAATGKTICEHRDIHHYNSTKRPIVWIFSGIGSQWLEMGTDLMKIPLFADTIDRCHKTLLSKGVHLKNAITSSNKNNFDNVLKSYIGIVAIEIGLINIMKAIGIEPDYIIGHSLGEIACAYADGCFTLEETILAAYSRGRANNDSKTIPGGMAAVGINHKELLDLLPKDIDIACHNGADSTTISGPAESVSAFVKQLEAKNIFAKEIACSGVALHSRYIKETGEILKAKLDEVIKTSKKRSSKWLSSTYPPDQWANEDAQYSSSKYHTMNLLNPVYFHEVVEQLPPNALTIEISPHGLLKPILKRSMKEGIHFSLAERGNKKGAFLLTETLGKIFQNGIDVDASKLYPPIQFPVSRNTPMISPVIEWDHSEDYSVPRFSGDWFQHKNILINVNDKEFEFIQGHVIDGKILFPGTGLLVLVWQTFALQQGVPFEKLPVIFEEVKFLRATNLMKNQDVILSISFHIASGNFEISEGQSAIAQGNIKVFENHQLTVVKEAPLDGGVKMLEEDFYKEMRLRGYYHHGLFRAVVEATSTDFGFQGKIKWNNEWTTFIDCLMQLQVLGRDIRQLVLPTKFRKLVIDPEVHLKAVSESSDGIIESVSCPYTRVLQAGGIEIHDFEGSAVGRRGAIVDPVLEVQTFLPHFPATPILSKIDAAKFCVQLLLENSPTSRIISVEIDSSDEKEVLSEYIFQALSDLPTITSEMNYLSSKSLELDNVVAQDKDLSEFDNANFIVRSQCLNDEAFLKKTKSSLADGGFIISREPHDKKLPVNVPSTLQLVATVSTEDELFFLLQFAKDEFKMPDSVIRITDKIDEWLEPLKAALNKGSVLAYSQSDLLSGILGLVNCIRREQPNLQCVFIDDQTAPPFDASNPFYKLQLQLGLVNNVYKNNQWGTYRHLRLKQVIEAKPRDNHLYANVQLNGDMSSIAWFEGSYNVDNRHKTPDCIRVHYSAINFRDVMQATGKISFDFLNRLQLQCVLGFEYSGVMNNGRRIFGFGIAGSFATHYVPTDAVLWDCPDHLSLKEAATIPLVYSTVYLAFFSEVKIQRGQSILIHAGSGGIGIAALHVAFHYGLEVFTTVSTQEKRNFLLNRFPLLKPENIGNSRDTSFEDMVMVQTKGRGVDYVLNSLSQEKLLASIRCVAEDGTFIEIGKFDIMNKTKIDMGFCAKRINIKTVFLQATEGNVIIQEEIFDMISDDLAIGVIQPLPTNVFEASDIQQAFRFLASGKHIGKVLVEMRKEENDLESNPIAAIPRLFCGPSASYIIIGGLGGFGLELADWLFLRGCKKIVLSSSRGVTNGYQMSRIKTWQSYNVQVIVNTSDVTTRSGCEQLINDALSLGPVGGIFNLAVALRDGLFENQTVTLFEESFGPKAVATKYMDELSRNLCPDLKHFVVFSSVSCGRGNAGQSNYGMANSIMERVIERRHELKLPAKAIQWGAVGDVGLLANLQLKNQDMQISGTLPQRIASCLDVLDTLLLSEDAVVSSMVVAEKHFSDFKKDNIIEALCNILGIRDKKTISMDSPLSKLGMDSLMTIEITQLLEREFSLALPLKELQSMTLYELEQRTKSKNSIAKDNDFRKQFGLELILKGISGEQRSEDTIVELSKGKNDKGSKTLIIPGIEGTFATIWKDLADQLNNPTFLLQTNKTYHATTFREIYECVIEDVLELYSKEKSFLIVGYSFGTFLSLEIARALESKGLTGNVVLIDGSPLYFQKFAESISKSVPTPDSGHNEVLSTLLRLEYPKDNAEILKNIYLAADWDSKLDVFMKFHEANASSKKIYSGDFISAIMRRFKMMEALDLSTFSHIKVSKLSLVKPSNKLVPDIDEFYGLSCHCSSNIEVVNIDANHISVLEHSELFNFINNNQ